MLFLGCFLSILFDTFYVIFGDSTLSFDDDDDNNAFLDSLRFLTYFLMLFKLVMAFVYYRCWRDWKAVQIVKNSMGF